MENVRFVQHVLPDLEIPAEVLSGFDPRFEEALWIQSPRATPALLVGNENLSYAPSQLKIPAEVVLYQPFSLPNQDRSRSADLPGLLRDAGLERGARVGLVGWKPQAQPEVPYWIVQAFTEVIGGETVNTSALLMDPEVGLRVTLEPEMIRFCEYASSLTSTALRRWVASLQEGLSERDAAALLQAFGLELSCHVMVNFGRPIPSGLKSPRNARITRGDYAQAAFGLIGGLTCRAGRLVGRDDSDDQDRYLDLVADYLRVVRAWYARLAVGVPAGAVVAAAERARAEPWDFAVNPGHLLHLDEWVSSPFYSGSSVALQSGYAIQQDIIPVPRQGAAVINMEDGFVLADDDLRRRLRRLDPSLMQRCERRRALMEALGFEIHPDVLPLSNIAGAFFPFLLDARFVAKFS